MDKTFRIDGITYQVEYKPIKNGYIRIVNENTILMSVPFGTSDKKIIEFINEKRKWITKGSNRYIDRINNSYLYRGGNSFYFFGIKYQITFIQGKNDVKINDKEIIVYCENQEKGLNNLYVYLTKSLKRETELYMEKYIEMLRDYKYYDVPNFKYRRMTSKWGVCFPKKNNITLNVYLVHYPRECLEYVLVHELCHFIVPNHSKRFYNLIELKIPNYKKIKDLLV